MHVTASDGTVVTANSPNSSLGNAPLSPLITVPVSDITTSTYSGTPGTVTYTPVQYPVNRNPDTGAYTTPLNGGITLQAPLTQSQMTTATLTDVTTVNQMLGLPDLTSTFTIPGTTVSFPMWAVLGGAGALLLLLSSPKH